MTEIDNILEALIEDEGGLESKDVYFPTDPLAVDLGPAIWSDDSKLRRAFDWMTRAGLAPKFGSVPIGWYQQDMVKSLNKLHEIAKKKGIDLRWVRKRGSRILAWRQDQWVPFAAILGGELTEAADDDFDMKDVSLGGPYDELAQLFAQGIVELSGKVERTDHHYVHERTTSLDLYNSYNWPDEMPHDQRETEEVRIDQLIETLEKYIQERLYDWNHKIFQELEDAYESEHEDEVIADNIRANNYAFDAEGNRNDAGGFQYDQLNDDAKSTARDWWNEANAGDEYYAEPVLAEWRWLLHNKGFEGVQIAYSGYYSQGDGASFTAQRIDFNRFFSGPDPLEFPEQDREQLSEAQENDFEVKDVATPTTPEEMAPEIARVLSAVPDVTGVNIARAHGEPEAVIISGQIKADHWDGGYAIDRAIFPFMGASYVEINRHVEFAAVQDVYPRRFAVVIKPKTVREALEERYGGAEGERAVFYHGTTSKLLPKILSQGLIPEPKVRAWSEDPNAGLIQPTRKSLSGIYVTTNLMTAIASANRVARRDKVTPIIVVMELQPRSLVGDEDSLGGSITALASHITDHVYSHIWPYFAEVYRDRMRDEDGHYAKLADKAKSQWVDDATKQLLYKFGTKTSPELGAAVRKLLFDEGYRIMLERMVSYSTDWDQSHYRTEWAHLFGTPEDVPPVPDKNQAEAKFLDFKDRLSRTMKASARPRMMKEWSFNTTGRSLEPIGFSGSNRIICVAEEIDERDPEYRSRLVVHYGQPPEQFIKDWKEAMGPLDKPDSIVYKNVSEAFEPHGAALARTGFWGTQAAGGVFVAQDTGRVLIGLRSGSVEQPHTWGTFGGAVDEGEDPAAAAKREMEEETGYSGSVEMRLLHVFEQGTFKYHNFAAYVPTEFEPRLNWENDKAEWVKPGEWPEPIHFGLADLIRHTGGKLAEATEDEEADLKELSKLDENIYLNWTYDQFDDPEYQPVWKTQGPFVSVKSAYDWAKSNLGDQRDTITLMEISRVVLGEIAETWIITQEWTLRQDFGQGYHDVSLPESEEDDDLVKAASDYPDVTWSTTYHYPVQRDGTTWPSGTVDIVRNLPLDAKLVATVTWSTGDLGADPNRELRRRGLRLLNFFRRASRIFGSTDIDAYTNGWEWAEAKGYDRNRIIRLIVNPRAGVNETADNDFDMKDVALPGQRWTYRIFRFPTCVSINYFVIEDSAFQNYPASYGVVNSTPPAWAARTPMPGVPQVGGHTFPRRTSDKDLHQIAQAQIRQFQRAGKYPRERYRNVWEWLRDVRDTGEPRQALPWKTPRRGNTYRET